MRERRFRSSTRSGRKRKSRRGVNYVLVDGAIRLKFVVDSGATDVSIPADVARVLMRTGKLTRSDYLGDGVFTLADGSRVPSRLFKIHSMKIGDREIRDVTASISNSRGALLLGQSFLRRFKSWSIDNRRRTLVLQDCSPFQVTCNQP